MKKAIRYLRFSGIRQSNGSIERQELYTDQWEKNNGVETAFGASTVRILINSINSSENIIRTGLQILLAEEKNINRSIKVRGHLYG